MADLPPIFLSIIFLTILNYESMYVVVMKTISSSEAFRNLWIIYGANELSKVTNSLLTFFDIFSDSALAIKNF